MIMKQPITIGNLTLHNRLVLPPMASKTSGDHGYVSDDMIAYYEDICRGGYIGLVITEHAYIHMGGKASEGQMSVAEDGAIEAYLPYPLALAAEMMWDDTRDTADILAETALRADVDFM